MPNTNSIGMPISVGGTSTTYSATGLPLIYTNGTNFGHSLSDIKPKQSQSADLPKILIETTDEHYNKVTMTLAPEPGISNSDLVKLFMLVTAMNVAPTEFSALAYVKKQNLERHFTYSS